MGSGRVLSMKQLSLQPTTSRQVTSSVPRCLASACRSLSPQMMCLGQGVSANMLYITGERCDSR